MSPPTVTSDRLCGSSIDAACVNYTVCQTWQYEVTPPADHIKDRVCADISNCTLYQFESTPPTATSDRRCTNITLESYPAPRFSVSPAALFFTPSMTTMRLASGDVVYSQGAMFPDSSVPDAVPGSTESWLDGTRGQAPVTLGGSAPSLAVTRLSEANVWDSLPRVVFMAQLTDEADNAVTAAAASDVPYALISLPVSTNLSITQSTRHNFTFDPTTGLYAPLTLTIPQSTFALLSSPHTVSVSFGVGSAAPTDTSTLMLQPSYRFSAADDVIVLLPAATITSTNGPAPVQLYAGTGAGVLQAWGLRYDERNVASAVVSSPTVWSFRDKSQWQRC